MTKLLHRDKNQMKLFLLQNDFKCKDACRIKTSLIQALQKIWSVNPGATFTAGIFLMRLSPSVSVISRVSL